MNFNKMLFLALLGILIVSSCKKDDDDTSSEPNIQVPSSLTIDGLSKRFW